MGLCGSGLAAQQSAQWSVAPTRLAEGESVTVNGSFDEPAWQRAAVLGKLTQVEPVEGASPSQPTRVRVAYDSESLYFAIECFDDPSEVRARIMTRDERLDPDDRVELWFDTYDTRRFAFWFQIGAAGSKGDGLISAGGSRFNKRWDGIWYGKSRLTGSGWQAEVALPFETVGFREGHSTWGFNFRRRKRAAGEDLRWASPLVAYRFFDLAVGGKLTGLVGMQQGLGLDVVPYVKVNASRDRAQRSSFTRDGDVGLDATYKITPSLNFMVTLNTDFAETEVDERRVNLTRFPLLFPEKRDFFLQDAGLFEFGKPTGYRRSADTMPFFSRRIGIDADGRAVPILGGMKVTGRAGDWNIGTLGVVQDATAVDREKALGVSRVSYNVGRESSVGMIATGGRPVGSGDAATVGGDFQLKDSRFFGPGHSAALWGYWMASQNDGPGDGAAYGVLASTRSRSWSHRLSFDAVGSNFSPELGFVRRAGIKTYAGETEYTWRSGDFVRKIEMNFRPKLVRTTGNGKDSWDLPLRWCELEFASQDRISLQSERSFERIPDFEIRPGLTVAGGDYTSTRHQASLNTSTARPLSLQLFGEYGDFFSGTLARWSVEPTLFASRYVRLSAQYGHYKARLDEGRFTTRVTEGRVDFTFSPDLSWRSLVQYDSDSKDMTVQSRVRWIVEPGQDLFLLVVYGWNRPFLGAPLIPTTQDLALKFAYTLRF